MTTAQKLSTHHRQQFLDHMAGEKLDILVIGGGITGAGIALDAATRGLRVGLVEKGDFSEGTSSRSTKLIHGGLRYLKQGEVKLVQEVGRERAILHHNAPHIVTPEKMLLPIIEKGTYGKTASSFGLWLYDRLAGVKHAERRVMLSREETLLQEPLLREVGLRGGGLYFEYRTDDARLTIEVMKTAATKGALCTNYAQVTELLYDDHGKIQGTRVHDQISGQDFEIFAKKIVNATGPWVDKLRDMDKSLFGKRLHHTKGVHIVVAYDRLPLQQSVYFDVPGGRMVFAIPRQGTTYIGTTDTNYAGSLEDIFATQEDVLYLLEAANSMFPGHALTMEDVRSSWAGVRPLIHKDGKSPSDLSRKDEVFISVSGLITIAGGKLTGFRKMAERVVDIAMEQLREEDGREMRACETDRITLSGGDISCSVPEFAGQLTRKFPDLHLSDKQTLTLVSKYGSNTESILNSANRSLKNDGASVAQALLRAEIAYSVDEEMATNSVDFLVHRTGRLYFERDSLEEIHPLVLSELSRMLEWDSSLQARYKEQFLSRFNEVVRFHFPAHQETKEERAY